MSDEVWGICNVCEEPVMVAERLSHPCPNFYVDYSWAALTNPKNEEWRPGYRFVVTQDSQKVGRSNVHRRPRVYNIEFEIDENGNPRVRKSSPTQPTADTLASVKAMVERHMPKLFLTREQLQHIVDSWEMANDPQSVEIAARAKEMLAKLA